ncbi:hypothetical protein P171DRAFT_445275 [Karstenula rhodostoma CBS 690.94]|uniref:Zn(2)-C6 fungal-type domain-containing protein n=1 Tax=Karstenula rhodostoma CBS 690.94 TaxID=1392251 RepID=A0A9P4UB22_9PLEO|nr:hypothetical protein P171DRAFT_445275 [Karstenula rhodostoma CBS 690.94]
MPSGDMNATKTRKPHRKSRSGCSPCKARHVKCDEQKPMCLNCDKYGSTCEYPRLRSAIVPEIALSPAAQNTPSSTQSAVVSRTNHNEIEDQELIADLDHMRLLHHFVTVTAKTLAHVPEVANVFSIYIPKVAFDNRYVLHAILSLTALHLSRSEPARRADYILKARRHHQIALAQFRAEVKDISESNLHVVLIFNAFLFPYTCAISASLTDLEDVFESIFSNLIVTRMVGPLLQASGLYEAMRQSDLGRIIPKDVHSVDWKSAEAPQETELVQLRRFSEVTHHIYPPEIDETYQEAIRLLDLLFDVTSKLPKPPSDSLLRLWIHAIPPRFVELLSEKQPGSLIIFAHYGVLLGRGRHYWFLEGMDELIIAVADAFVPTEWKNWLDWPKEQIRAYRTPISQPTST